MSPRNMVHVVEAAWLLVALVFRQQDVCAAALQVSRRQQGCSDSLLHIMYVMCLQRPLLSACVRTLGSMPVCRLTKLSWLSCGLHGFAVPSTVTVTKEEACTDLRKRAASALKGDHPSASLAAQRY
jgi:hypothetical protein